MNLFENPIFLTQKRLVHRGGVLAAIIIAGLLGLSLLCGLIAHLANPVAFRVDSPESAGRMFYVWIVVTEGIILILGGFSRVSRALADDRKAGLWDSNRLTPLKPCQLVTGYWFGSGLREFYMAVILAAAGLVMVLLAKLSITLWLGTQVLIFSTALFFGLLGLLVGLAFERPQGMLFVLGIFLVYPFSFVAPGRMLTNFLLPTYGIVHLFQDPEHPEYSHQWESSPTLFGVPVPAVLLTAGVQLLVGIFLWRATLRKTARPFQPILLRWEAIALFAILILTQHGLVWDIWHGQYPAVLLSGFRANEHEGLIPIIHGATILLAIIILTSASPMPETLRVESLRSSFRGIGPIFSRSAVSLAMALAVISGLAIFLQCMNSLQNSWRIVAVVAINLAELFITFALLLEFCRVRHKRRAIGFIALWLFILWGLPFICAGVFFNSGFGRISLLSPGFYALADTDADWGLLFLTELAHLGVVVVFFGAWLRQWKRLLAKTSTT